MYSQKKIYKIFTKALDSKNGDNNIKIKARDIHKQTENQTNTKTLCSNSESADIFHVSVFPD